MVAVVPLLNSLKSDCKIVTPFSGLIMPFSTVAYDMMKNSYLFSNKDSKIGKLYLEIDPIQIAESYKSFRYLKESTDGEEIYVTRDENIVLEYDISYFEEDLIHLITGDIRKLSDYFIEAVNIEKNMILSERNPLGKFLSAENYAYRSMKKDPEITKAIADQYGVVSTVVENCFPPFNQERETVQLWKTLEV